MLVIRNGSTYYYKSRWVGGRPVKEFVAGGAGLLGDLAAALQAEDDAARAEARAVAEAERAGRERLAALDATLCGVVAEAVGAARGALEALGYHRVARGRWRKKRRASEMAEAQLATVPRASIAAPLGGPMATPDRVDAFTLETIKDLAEMVRFDGSDRPESGEPGLTRGEASVYRQVHRHARELAGPETTPVEWHLSVTAALVWWETRHAESCATLNRVGATSLKTMELLDRRTDRLRRRYALLLKTLAEVRKLAAPTLVQVGQLNVARGRANQQVNNGNP